MPVSVVAYRTLTGRRRLATVVGRQRSIEFIDGTTSALIVAIVLAVALVLAVIAVVPRRSVLNRRASRYLRPRTHRSVSARRSHTPEP